MENEERKENKEKRGRRESKENLVSLVSASQVQKLSVQPELVVSTSRYHLLAVSRITLCWTVMYTAILSMFNF